jgi:MoxR-like ATPase
MKEVVSKATGLDFQKGRDFIEEVKTEVAKIVVGQEEVIEAILRALLANGHVLIEGVPGVAKTLLIRSIAQVAGCSFSRIQFTVDLLPADITGLTTYTPGKGFETIKGPIFANFIIADEINRAPPKTQSALLEAMQERQVTIGRKTYSLDLPFLVMANNNPLESSGTYRLPEAQIDRFLFKLKMGYPTMEEEEKIIDNNITINKFEDFGLKAILSQKKIIDLQELTKRIYSSPQVKKYIVRIVDCTRNPKNYGLKLGNYIDYGGSPRATIALQIAAKADAVLRGQNSVTPQNVKNVAHDVLRHRLLLNYEGQAENIDSDEIIDEILSKVKVP